MTLKLAECELIRETVGEYPVVLLDDVMSELELFERCGRNLRDINRLLPLPGADHK